MSAPTTPQPGLRLGRYDLVARLGVGGMGELWIGRQKSLGGFERLVAVKRILPRFAADPVFVQRFAMEAQLAASLSHPNIVQIHDFEEDRGEVFIAMELVRGETLQTLIRRSWELTGQPVSPVLGAGIMAQVCRALHYAHTHVDPVSGTRGLVHRDVAPANVLIGFRGEVKVVDFGIARALTDSDAAAGPLHGDGSGGRAAYMSPEQARGEELDARSDLFAAGIVLWELITGMRLFGGMEADQTRQLVAGPDPVRLASQARPGMDAELSAIAARALAKDRNQRFADAGEMAKALEQELVRLGSPHVDEGLAALMDQLFRDQKERWSQVGAAAATVVSAAPIAPAATLPFTLAKPEPRPEPPVSTAAAAPVELPALDVFDATLPDHDIFSEVTDPDDVRASALISAAAILAPRAPEPAAKPVATASPAQRPRPARAATAFAAASFYATSAPTPKGTPYTLDIALLWGETVMSSKTFRRPQDVVLGHADTADFVIPREVLGRDAITIVRGTGSGFALDLSNPGVTGDVLLDDEVWPIADVAELETSVPIEGQLMRARLKIGEFTLLIARVPVVVAPTFKQSFDAAPFYFVGLSALWQIAMVIIAWATPDDLLLATRDPRAQRQRVIETLKITPQELEEQKVAEEKREEEIKKDDKKKPDDELKVDRKQLAPAPDPTPQPERTSSLVDKMHRPRDSKNDQIQPLSPSTKSSVDELKQRLALSTAAPQSKLSDVRTNLDPNSTNDPLRVTGAYDPSGGAPAPSFATDGSANAPAGPLAGEATRELGKKLADGGPVRSGPVRGKVTGMKSATKVTGSLEAGAVYDVIDKSIGKIQACYEGRLRVDASLAGRITFRWTVTTSGSVSGVQQTASTISDPEVAACVKRVLQTLRFPKPSGGVVEVSYPFIFRNS